MAAELLLGVHLINLDKSVCVFTARIESWKTVGDLKNAILEKTPNILKGIDAFQLTLYRVEHPDNGTIADDMNHILKDELKVSTRMLSKVFPIQPSERTINVLVEVPHVITPGL